jgi:hypothetical protein
MLFLRKSGGSDVEIGFATLNESLKILLVQV